MTLDQYWYVIRRHWLALLIFVTLLPAFTFAFSFAQLMLSPKYLSYLDISLLPSAGELSFTKDFFGGTRERQANAFDSTTKEYIKSRPVIERALEITNAQLAATEPAAPKRGVFASIGSAVKNGIGFLRRLYVVINLGKYVDPDPADILIDQLQRAITIRSIEGSFLLRIEVILSDPERAAAFANALAVAYVELSSEQAAKAAQDIKTRLAEQIAVREQRLQALVDQEFELRRTMQALSLEDERLSTISTLENEQLTLFADKVELEQLATRYEHFEKRRATERQRDLLQSIEIEIAQIESRREELSRRITVRTKIIADLRKKIDDLASKERPFLEFKQKRDLIQREIESLSDPIASLELASYQERGMLRVISAAEPPLYPESPKVIRNTALAVIAGLLIAAMVIVLIDVFGRRVRTLTDLRRVADKQALCVLRQKDLVGQRAPPRMRHRAHRRRLTAIGAQLDQQLAVLGNLDRSIAVTGFGPARFVSGLTMTLGTALALCGNKVSCSFQRAEDAVDPPLQVAGGKLSIVQAGDTVPADRDLNLYSVEPMSAGFKWASVAAQCDSIICGFPADALYPETLQDFAAQAKEAGIRHVLFVIVEIAAKDVGRDLT